MTSFPPIRRDIVVSASAARAFAAWTDDLSSWWPFATHSVYGAGSTAVFKDNAVLETGPDGETCSWGDVLVWEAGRRVTMTWHPGFDEDEATTVDVSFEELSPGRTRVTVTHSGWETRADSGDVYAGYETGWTPVMQRFADAVGPSAA